MPFLRRCLLVVLVPLLAGMPGAHAANSATGTDAQNDVVNPTVGMQLPAPLRYSQPPADIVRWSIATDGAAITASVTMNGLLRDYYEQLAWATIPGVLLLFESPSQPACLTCTNVRNGVRIGFYYRANPCPDGPSTASLVRFEPGAAQPLITLVPHVPFTLSANGTTVTWRLPYSSGGVTIVKAGEDLTNISVVSVTETAQAVSAGIGLCVLATAQEGIVDWAPQTSWDPRTREVKPTAIDISA
jgi:hypothetical protein